VSTVSFFPFSFLSSFNQTIPSRFVKVILKAVDENDDGFLDREEAERFLDNIGAGDKLSSAELTEIMTEIVGEDGGDADKIPISRVKALLLEHFE
jgi:Ca2+-binding EF-hand superfamily protein